MDTIAAISTPAGSGAISIVRLSGGQSLQLALRFFSCKKFTSDSDIIPSMMYLGTFAADNFHEKCMLVYFRAPRSYTGEDVVEIHVHGGYLLTADVLKALLSAGARMAEPGEFTKRAFLAGKLTLGSAEGIAGMINAGSEAELNAAYSLMSGRFGAKISELSDSLLQCVSTMEAALDYPEEMQDEVCDSLQEAKAVKEKMQELLATGNQGKLIKDGINVAILGKTNVGKSSLLNAILGYARAIVTDIPGTTRDVVQESFNYKGVRINFQDTAGIRDTGDTVEALGIQRSLNAARSADVIVYMVDSAEELSAEEESFLAGHEDKKIILVYNKADLHGNRKDKLNISAIKGEGLGVILDQIIESISADVLSKDVLTEERHFDCIKRAYDSLCAAVDNYLHVEIECTLLDLRASINALMEIDGGGATERVINDVFGRFCVGK